MNRGELAERVLLEIGRQARRIRRRPRPKPWRHWDVNRDLDDRELGPLYTPRWFGEAAQTEAGRVRHLRAVYTLAAADLVTLVKSDGDGVRGVERRDP